MSSGTNAQWVFNFGKNYYQKTKIVLEDGSVKEGFVLNFRDKRIISNEAGEVFKTEEENLGLSNPVYYFRANEKGKDEKIPIADIHSITLYNYSNILKEEYEIVYQKTKMARVRNNGQIKYYNGDFLLPVFYSNPKITVFHFNTSICPNPEKNSCFVFANNFYLKAHDDEYAIKPLHIDESNIFLVTGKFVEKFHIGNKYLGKNCPNFIKAYEASSVYKNTNNQKIKSNADPLSKNTRDLQKEMKNDLKEKKKLLKKDEYNAYKEERFEKFVGDVETSFYNALFDEVVQLYINSCE